MTERIETAELERLALVLDRGFGNPTFKERHDAATALRELIAIRAHTAAQPAPDAVAEAAKVLLDTFSAKDLSRIYAERERLNGSLAKAWTFQAMLRYIMEGHRP